MSHPRRLVCTPWYRIYAAFLWSFVFFQVAQRLATGHAYLAVGVPAAFKFAIAWALVELIVSHARALPNLQS